MAALLASSNACSVTEGSLLTLYEASSLIGMHSHPIGPAGHVLDRLERAHNRKRARVAARLALIRAPATISAIDDEQRESATQVVYTRSLTEDEENSRLVKARSALNRLDRCLRSEATR